MLKLDFRVAVPPWRRFLGHIRHGQILPFLFLALGMLLMYIAGCSNEHYKQDADKEVREIIDSKWSEDYGTRANASIADVEAHPDDLPAGLQLPDTREVSLKLAVALATANNREYQDRKEDLYLTALDLSLFRHAFATQYFGLLSGDYVHDATGETTALDGELGFDRLLKSGALISARIASDWTRFLTGHPDQAFGSLMTISMVQPLLRGAGEEIVTENLTQAERNVIYELREFSRFRKTFVVGVVSGYLGVLRAHDQVNNNEFNYKLKIDSRKRAAMLADAGRQERFEVDQAEQAELTAKNALISSRQTYESLLDQFKITLALPTDTELKLDPQELQGLGDLVNVDPNYTVDHAIKIALENRLDLATSYDRVDDTRRRLHVAENNLDVELNLVGSVNVGSDENNRLSNRLDFSDGTYSLGFESDFDLDRKEERNAYREAQIAVTREERHNQQDIDDIKLAVREALRVLQLAAQSYIIQEQSVKLAETRVDSTNMLLQAGRAETRDLLDSQDDLLTAQNALTSALIAHTIAKLVFYTDIGLLQVKPDGLWEPLDNEQANAN